VLDRVAGALEQLGEILPPRMGGKVDEDPHLYECTAHAQPPRDTTLTRR
jgi:hypothetical protein